MSTEQQTPYKPGDIVTCPTEPGSVGEVIGPAREGSDLLKVRWDHMPDAPNFVGFHYPDWLAPVAENPPEATP